MKNILFEKFNNSHFEEIDKWEESEKVLGSNGLQKFVMIEGERLGKTISFFTENCDNILSVVAKCQQEIIGFIVYSVQDSHFHIELTAINPLYRGQGLMKDMLLAFKKKFPEATMITLSVNKSNTSGIRAFEKSGKRAEKQNKENYFDYEI